MLNDIQHQAVLDAQADIQATLTAALIAVKDIEEQLRLTIGQVHAVWAVIRDNGEPR